MSGAWRLDPFKRVVRFVGEFPEPSDAELRSYGYEVPERRPIIHGTEGGYRQHRTRGQDACADCAAAMKSARVARREKSRDAA